MASKKTRAIVITKNGASQLVRALRQRQLEIDLVSSEAVARARLNERFADVLFVDIDCDPSGSGVCALHEQWPELPLVAFGPEAAESSALAAVRAGALHYLTVPVDEDAVTNALATALSHAGAQLSGPPPLHEPEFGLLGHSVKMREVREAIARVAAGTASVIVRGENGTGKELVARAVHTHSPRRQGPFVKVHTPALPDTLFESELFGYEKGAFTGAGRSKPGRVELAEGGTLFLDEIADMSQAMQAKLLRLVQDREFERLGGVRSLRVNLRFVTATNRDLEHMVDVGQFRQDLYYRLNVVTIWLPPLRARREDIPLLAHHYFEKFKSQNGREQLTLSVEVDKLLCAQRWPGNVRQLVNFMERLVVMTEGNLIDGDAFRREFAEQRQFTTQSLALSPAEQLGLLDARDDLNESGAEPAAAPESYQSSLTVRPMRVEVHRAERRALEKALRAAGGNRSLAARLLGMSRRSLYDKLDEHELS